MPRNNKCDHPNCYSGQPCKMLTPEELVPTDEDVVEAQQLIAEGGWFQTSSKFRMIMRWKAPPPTIAELINPAFAGTYFEQVALKRFQWGIVDEMAARMAPESMVEQRTLSLRVFKEWKRLRRQAEGGYVANFLASPRAC